MKSFTNYLKYVQKNHHYHVLKDPVHFAHVLHVRHMKDHIPSSSLHTHFAHIHHAPHFQEDVNTWLNHNENHELGKTSADVSRVLKKARPKTTLGQRLAVSDYTQESGDLNRNLINKHFNKAELEPHHKEIMKHLDKVAKNPIGHNIHAYSGLGFNPITQIKDHGGLRKLQLPAYTSATHDKETANNFAAPDENGHKHILHIHLKPTDKAFHVGDMSSWAAKPQHEMLLPRNTKLHIHSSETHGDTTVHHATIHNGND